MVKVCYFGTYNEDLTRTRIILQGLLAHKVTVNKCAEQLAHIRLKPTNRWSHMLYHLLVSIDLLKNYAKLVVKFVFSSNGCKVVIVSFPFRYDAILAYLLCFVSRKKIVVDYFMSMYETSVVDRKKVKAGSLIAEKLFLLDYLTTHLADKIVVDTAAHAAYYKELFNIKDQEKFIVVPIGAYDKIIHPTKIISRKKNFRVIFWGYFVPLQGIEYIIKSAKLLESYEDIQFIIIGIGQTFSDMVKLAKDMHCKNLDFLGEVSYDALPAHINNADICLGIFGDHIKTEVVIPNKAYETIAVKKPLLTSDTQAIRELFNHKENCFLCEKANEHSLAEAILYLKRNNKLRKSIAEQGYILFKEKCTPVKVVRNLVKYINTI